MPAPRTVAAVVLAALAVTLLGLQVWQGRAEPGDERPAGPAPRAASPRPTLGASAGGVTQAAAAPAPGLAAGGVIAAAPAASDATAQLEAARVLRLFCRLIDTDRMGQAMELLAPGAWSARELRALAGLRFVSARVYGAPDTRSLVMLTHVTVRLRAPSPLPEGDATLFFTLGRVGTTTGGWLITAVSTSP